MSEAERGLSKSELLYEIDVLVEEWRDEAELDAAMGNHDAADRWGQAANQLEEVAEDAQ